MLADQRRPGAAKVSPENFGLTFDHFGLAVRDPDGALRVLHGLGYDSGDSVYDPLQNVNLIWCEHAEMPAVELVSPAETPGPLQNILSEQPEMLYHLCFSSANLEASVAAIRDAGIRVLPVAEPKPAVLFGGRKVGFYQVRGFGLVEIVEEE